MKFLSLLVLLVIIGAIATFALLRISSGVLVQTSAAPLKPAPTQVTSATALATQTAAPKPTRAQGALLTATTLPVPFLAQAPFANWDPLHEEACEEASLLNVMYFMGQPPFESKAKGDEQIQALVAYEESQNMGVSITLDQLNQVARDFHGLKTGRIETNVTIDDIKQELAGGKPVIVGAAGKILPNPFFSNGGPVYHMLVIKGYDDNGVVPLNKCKRVDGDSCSQTPGIFITNDVGISQGNSFAYTYQGLYKTIRDWDPVDIHQGNRSYLVFD